MDRELVPATEEAPNTPGPTAALPPVQRPQSWTLTALRYAIVGCLAVLGMLGGAGLTQPSHLGWSALILGSLWLWAGWLYWRTALGDRDVPGHLLHPFLAAVIVILLGHLLATGKVDPTTRQIQLLAGGDVSVLTRVMVLGLMLLLVQDVFSRVRHLRWLLTAMGLVIAVGAWLRLVSGQAAAGATALALSGFAGVGVFLTPLVLPALRAERVLPLACERLQPAATVVRLGIATALAGLIMVAQPSGGVAAMIAITAAGAALCLSAGFLRLHRARLAGVGAVLVGVGIAGLARMDLRPPAWLGELSVFGTGLTPVNMGSGARLLGVATGWAGLALILAGMAASLAWSLRASRWAAAGDQARTALWAGVAAVSGCALLADGGMAVPGVAVTVAVVWGLMPHVMAHRVRRFHGLAVVAAFAAALTVLALEQQMHGTVWAHIARRYGDGPMHFFGTFVLTGVLFWQLRSHRWWQGLLCALAAAAIATAGELAQRFLSTRCSQWSDVGWNVLGAAAALGGLLLVHAVMWLEWLVATGSGRLPGRCDQRRKSAGPAGHPAGRFSRPAVEAGTTGGSAPRQTAAARGTG